MPDTAVTQAPRLIELIAWLSQGDNRGTITYKAAARKFGVSEAQIRDDLDVLVHLSDEHKDFLASVRVAIVADGFTVVSRGPFRRPIQFSARGRPRAAARPWGGAGRARRRREVQAW